MILALNPARIDGLKSMEEEYILQSLGQIKF